MKKIVLLSGLLAGGLFAGAQNANFGLKGGLNLATQDRSDNANVQNRVGYHAGLFVNIPASRTVSVQPEVVYSNQGAKYALRTGDVVNLQMNYVNIPVMVQANVGGGFYAQAGPQLGILTSVSDKIGDVEINAVSKQDFKSTDVALGFGLGYKGRSGLGVDARYNLGLTNVNNFGNAVVRNNVFQLGLLLQLDNGRRR